MRDSLNIMHNMPSTLNDMGISACTAEAVRAAKLPVWKVMLEDWRDVGLHTTVWTADHDEHTHELATQQQDFNEDQFSDKHLQIRWAMMAKSEMQEETTDEGASEAIHDYDDDVFYLLLQKQKIGAKLHIPLGRYVP